MVAQLELSLTAVDASRVSVIPFGFPADMTVISGEVKKLFRDRAYQFSSRWKFHV